MSRPWVHECIHTVLYSDRPPDSMRRPLLSWSPSDDWNKAPCERTRKPGARLVHSRSGGYDFNHFYYEKKGRADEHNNRVDVGDGPYVGAKLSIRY